MEALVINLDSRVDRWKNIKKRFKFFKLNRVPAVVKTVGSYGNFLSVIKAIELAKKKGLDEVVILEDDSYPVKGFEKKWVVIKEWLHLNQDKWDIYSGGATNIFFPKLIDEYKGIKFFDPVWCTASHYIYIQKRSYDKLLEYYKKYSVGANHFKMLGVDVHNNLFKTVISNPFIAYQDSGFSDITKTKRSTLKKVFRNSERTLI